MTTVYTVRHAQSAGNLKKIFQGRLDIGLSEMGMEQLEPLSKRFEHVAVSAVYSSPLKRARQTAEAICHVCHAPLIIDQRLIEIDGGAFQGKRYEELAVLFPERYQAWVHHAGAFEAPDGESMRQVYDRMRSALCEIVRKHVGGTIVLVSHGCAICNLMCYVHGTGVEQVCLSGCSQNTAISRIDFDEELRPKVIFENDASHLPRQYEVPCAIV
ncbi:MAG TPA: histidine phosphatase family protein [Firmicutes bacterium]|nr:histidine phosphatase family protein [Bacillota bacterium]